PGHDRAVRRRLRRDLGIGDLPGPAGDRLARMSGEPGVALALDGVVKQYPGGVAALSGVSVEIPAGDQVAVLGPSGSGKTTLLTILGTLERPTSGVVRVADHDVGSAS